MSEKIDKNYLRAIVLLLIGMFFMVSGIAGDSLEDSNSFSISGGFLFLSGIILYINRPNFSKKYY